MRKVQRSEIVDYQTYDETRAEARRAILQIKQPRRIHVGPYLTFLFENSATVRYQIQEVMRAERIVREADIQHEIETYNALLGDAGQLGCCLLVEIDDAAERPRLLRAWRDLPAHLYLRCDDGRQIQATVDAAQIDDEKISAVQYLKFDVGGVPPLAAGCDLPGLEAETPLTPEQRAALADDLAVD